MPTEHGGLGPMRARKMKRMDRRPKYWRCSFCRQENVVAEQRSVYNTGNVARLELGDGHAVARERARRTAREKETRGRSLNARRRL